MFRYLLPFICLAFIGLGFWAWHSIGYQLFMMPFGAVNLIIFLAATGGTMWGQMIWLDHLVKSIADIKEHRARKSRKSK